MRDLPASIRQGEMDNVAEVFIIIIMTIRLTLVVDKLYGVLTMCQILIQGFICIHLFHSHYNPVLLFPLFKLEENEAQRDKELVD